MIQEAMASGLPVVAARAGGSIDLVNDGTTGQLFAPGSAVELRAQIDELLAAPLWARAMGTAGRRLAERRSWPHVIADLLHYYTQAISRAERHQHRLRGRLIVGER